MVIATVVLAAFIVLGLFVWSSYEDSQEKISHPVAMTDKEPRQKPATREELLTGINAERVKAGIPIIISDDRLNGSAQQKANDMLVKNYFGHVDPNGRHGYDIAHEYAPDICTEPGENLSWTKDRSVLTAEAAIKGWMESKPHHDALLNPKYKYTGFGIENYIVVEHFC